MHNQIQREFAISSELNCSINLIKLGLGEYQNLGGENDFYYLPFQLISSGLERLMKCHICLGHHEKHGDYPSQRYIKAHGHDLLKLRDHIVANYYNHKNIPALKEDLDYLQTDSDINKLLNILSEFGKLARYHNLDVITNSANSSINAEIEWESFETELVLRDEDLIQKIGKIESSKEVNEQINRMIVIILERFTRAICRQFTLGRLGAKAQQLSTVVFNFIIMEDDDLGNTNYRTNTTNFTSNLKAPHKRTIFDKWNRLANKNYKHKKMKKIDFGVDWPFYADEVIIECRDKHWCIVTINDHDYALNGSAQGRFRLPNVTQAGMAILGKSTQQFIDIALSLSNN